MDDRLEKRLRELVERHFVGHDRQVFNASAFFGALSAAARIGAEI